MSIKLRHVEPSENAPDKMWMCPGCKIHHGVRTGPGGWGWNGSMEAPTFTPSVLVNHSNFTEAGWAAYDAWCAAGYPKPAPQFESKAIVCHSFVTDGKMQFLGDCTHALANQTVEIPDVEKD